MADPVQQAATPVAASSPVAAPKQPIVITVQMPPAAEVHWTAYATAVATPSIALLAVAAATYVGFRNWRTAHNKLKLELFDKRLEAYEQLNNIRETVAHTPFYEDTEVLTRFNELRPKFRWMFDDKVNFYVDIFSFKVRAYTLLNEGDADESIISKDASSEEQRKMIREVKVWMRKESLNIQDVFHASLKLEQ